ncbi:putative transcription factor B3-Domain family [Rosa chinensis]|uniref:Putative transcription factor B3-Domain family n=1 Tax=Rosa chinensis TaxID=74649 RepID=A0A2P6PXD6_ROSCH|nr:B3 domain-containing protein REM5 isoform X1 [Rosa chinensis]PRQ26591.1 putative transcription factor B3-Domain family [Rosa chinensis]
MARKTEHPARRQAFFKALMGDFSQHLRIPSAFIKNLNRRSLHTCRLKGPSGQCWVVELEKRGNRLFFHKGWEEFVKHHPLEVGDFLIFSCDGVSMFDVTIYGKTFCEKNVKAAKRRSGSNGIAAKRSGKLPRRSDSHADKRRAVDGVEETSLRPIPFQSKNSFICRVLTARTLYEVYIPTEVVIAEGLKAGTAIKIQDTFEMSWHLRLRANHDRVLMRSGLSNICKANKTSHGDTVIFEFVKPRVVQLHIIRAGVY